MTTAAPGGAAEQLVVFVLDGRRYALALAVVERIIGMVEIAPFPKAPEIVGGVIDFHGELMPVFDVRRRFRLPARPHRLQDQLLIARTRRRRVALAVDAVEDVVTCPAGAQIDPATVVPGLEYVRGVTRIEPHGLVFVHDLDSFLSLEEEEALAAAEAK